ncbi:MAG: hypothetical protein NTW19_09495 [Planctomycetota bacterium]|nr:hypothetical protein [Planctomycetota bacterium]
MTRILAFACLLTLLASVRPASADETAMTIRDFTARGFCPDAVNYTVDLPYPRMKFLKRLAAEGGPIVPCQVTPGPDGGSSTLTFVTDLPPNATRTFRIVNEGADPPAPSVKLDKVKDAVELTSNRGGVRLPPLGEKTFDKPVPANTLPAPILAFRANGADAAAAKWIGGGKILSERLAKSLSVKTIVDGPVLTTVRYEIQWAAGGFYRADVTMTHDVPLAKVREEFDVNEHSDADFWEIDLGSGWSPDRYEFGQHFGNGVGGDTTTVETIDKLVDRAKRLQQPTRWCLGLFREEEQKAKPDDFALVGYIPMNRGWWRRTIALQVESTKPGEARVRFPMAVRPAVWYREIGSDTSPYSMQEHDPALPVTLGRRAWGLVLGTPKWPQAEKAMVSWSAPWHGLKPLASLGPMARLWSSYGIVGLDRYKDFILEWPDSGVKYPRLYRTAPAEKGDKLPIVQEKELRWIASYFLSYPDPSHHVCAGNYLFADHADEVLSWPGLPAEKRAELRAQLALAAYLYEEADVMQYANGSHPGNPNMGTARFMSADTFLALLPDHPMAAAWRTHMAGFTEYKMATQIAPGGGYFEFGGAYHMHGYARTTNALPGLVKAGADEKLLARLFDYHKQDWDYYLNLLTPIYPRWGTRMIPGMANSPPSNTATFSDAAGSIAPRDKPFAANLLWAWNANGASTLDGNPSLKAEGVEPVEPKLASRLFPGIGVIFRAHQGPDETYMLLRSGFNWSHWYTDPGHFILFSRGAPLVPDQPYQYWGSPDKNVDVYNTVRFGDPSNQIPYGWPDGNVLDHRFGPSVDYAWVSTGVPDWFIEPGATPPFRPADGKPVRLLSGEGEQKQGAFSWDRQVVFLKGKTATEPNYFVIRDSTSGPGSLTSHLFLNLLGRKENVQFKDGRMLVDTEWPTKLDVAFLQPTPPAPDFTELSEVISPHGANFAARWPKEQPMSRNWISKDGKPVTPATVGSATEQHVVMRLTNPPGQGQTWVLFPRGKDEAPPKIESPSPGVVKVTHAQGVDYVFLGLPTGELMKAKVDDVEFMGFAGAVRVGKEKVTFTLTRGMGRAGYKGHVLVSNDPFEASVPIGEIKPGQQVMHSEPAADFSPDPAIVKKSQEGSGLKTDEIVQVSTQGDATTYVTSKIGAPPWSKDGVCINGGPSSVIVSPGKVRFISDMANYVQLSAGAVGVRGVGPFDLTFTDTEITGKVAGKMRSLAVTWPKGIVRPMFTLDGVRWFAGFADDPSYSKGLPTPQFAVAFAVFDGKHDVAVREWAFPAPPPLPPRTHVKF